MLVKPLSAVDNTRAYARVSLSRQWYNYNLARLGPAVMPETERKTLFQQWLQYLESGLQFQPSAATMDLYWLLMIIPSCLSASSMAAEIV